MRVRNEMRYDTICKEYEIIWDEIHEYIREMTLHDGSVMVNKRWSVRRAAKDVSGGMMIEKWQMRQWLDKRRDEKNEIEWGGS